MRRLKTEKEIIKNWKGDIDKPLVSVCCITYNHGNFIEDALVGFLIQETDFPFEILIHDDASPDNTAEVIRQYHRNYPKIIKPIYQKINQFSLGKEPSLEFNFPRAKGKYIASCEGDDFWTNSKKLDKQVRFLETNKDFIATTHKILVVDENKNKLVNNLNMYNLPSSTFSLSDFNKSKLPGQTSSLVYRNIWKTLNKNKMQLYGSCKTNGDRKLSLMLTLNGKIYCFPDIMSSYRKVTYTGTSWSARNSGKNLALKKYKDLIELNIFSQKAFGVKLNNKKQRLNAFYVALLVFIKKPNMNNLNILKQILNLKIDRKYELIFYALLKILLWPSQKIKRKLCSKPFK